MKNFPLLISISILLSFCTQKRTDGIIPDDSETQLMSVQSTNEDSQNISDINADINVILNNGNLSGARTESADSITSTYKNDSLFIEYKNAISNSGNKVKKGKVTITLKNGKKWRDPGALLEITFHNLSLRSLDSSKNTVINGTQTFRNIIGGLPDLPNTWLVGKAEFQIKNKLLFNNVIEKKSYEYNVIQNIRYQNLPLGPGFDVKITGDSASQVFEWGKNSLGKKYSKKITQPLVLSLCYSPRNKKITRGEVVLETENTQNILMQYGYDANENLVPSNSICNANYLLITWKNLKDENKKHLVPISQ